ncbi:MAG: hypothetical protein KUA43_16100 [Hoeflea sp.]|uniref:hypothetical protein n=1 Tax=Hoeflea sp. TaxID=1940281 RepID=UPI001D77FC6C|nr:hypothetical protein [Hoeflea sp.]MBU4531683.1 hypothetical protein [Alphaproteobacteria bacterium]MBU4544539.1 hypothetical protein [Alphaproteobacteria bacterium]MBU4552770.1 hypothetical protein [Alphaproteobacteria bacterium]MBV1724959.1 hypothetical protein [Hoeflea sp.]MBV1760979.1 hypothetical protein [Hoeflea sp.]
MDWTLAIERNLKALRQIAGSLVAMAGLNPPQPTVSLPRHIHAAVLSILRPAEAALRRLIVIAARDLVVTLSPAERDRIAKTALPAQTSRTGIFLNGRPARPEDLAALGRGGRMTAGAATIAAAQARSEDAKTRPPAFLLFDPLKRFGAHRQGPSQWVPRILFDLDTPPPAPAHKPASPNDPVSALPLCRRLAALKTALDDLPGQAQRLARWRARRRLRRSGRLSPMRPGSPPGHRTRGSLPVDEVLHHCHGLAIDVVMRNDTS